MGFCRLETSNSFAFKEFYRPKNLSKHSFVALCIDVSLVFVGFFVRLLVTFGIIIYWPLFSIWEGNTRRRKTW